MFAVNNIAKTSEDHTNRQSIDEKDHAIDSVQYTRETFVHHNSIRQNKQSVSDCNSDRNMLSIYINSSILDLICFKARCNIALVISHSPVPMKLA